MKYRHHRVKLTAKNIPDRVSIHERPKEADGSRFGDWEMDTIVGPGRKGLLKMRTNLSDSISRKRWTWILSLTGNLLSLSLKSMTDLERNSTSTPLNRVSSNILTNITLASCL